ncbi:hypothetical protein A3B60_01780 [Candidatus Peregrinibacteria bacterium RIFCSPLOWO2_01_FULL_39_12]|nr:MAG: hypothetical protein A3I58_01935 [Candidatus Peregrinibacteria bacterium RIFCSPLOWO2_02_FULL_39_10]OGJ43158.1 MAG: hypothetical protein A3B60_01780 [Candidatus Peregrinibacteria bacterium RIFCSPLOWO2_01_FULL_39_12]
MSLLYIFDNSLGIEYSCMIFKNKKKIKALEKLIKIKNKNKISCLAVRAGASEAGQGVLLRKTFID